VFHTAFGSPEEVRRYYATYYTPHNLEVSSLTTRNFERLVDTFQPYRSSGRILDIGCGAGHFLSVAGSRGWDTYGTEVAAGLTDRLQALGIHSFHGELADAKYESAFFDVVYCSEVIEHVLRPVDLLREVARVLRSGGLLYLTTPNFDSLSRRLLGARWRVLCQEHICYFTPRVLTRALESAGLRPLTVRTRNIDPHECGKLFGRGPQSGGGFQAETTDQWRNRLSERASLRLLKWITNGVLAATSAGDTIVARAVNP
jgi:SAM-dependent methyltransferase